jgi:hypothetical protein
MGKECEPRWLSPAMGSGGPRFTTTQNVRWLTLTLVVSPQVTCGAELPPTAQSLVPNVLLLPLRQLTWLGLSGDGSSLAPGRTLRLAGPVVADQERDGGVYVYPLEHRYARAIAVAPRPPLTLSQTTWVAPFSPARFKASVIGP